MIWTNICSVSIAAGVQSNPVSLDHWDGPGPGHSALILISKDLKDSGYKAFDAEYPTARARLVQGLRKRVG